MGDADDDIDAGITHLVSTAASRRAFLFGGGALLGGLALAGSGAGRAEPRRSPACGRAACPRRPPRRSSVVISRSSRSPPGSRTSRSATYQAGIDAATKGTLGAVPPAVVTFAITAQSQHQDHAAAWNGVLTGAGKKAITGVDLTVKKSVDKAFAMVKDVPGLAMLALDLENVAAATYLAAIDVVKDPAGIKTAASIEPVELQHAAILNFLLGQYPVPDSFSKKSGARPASDKIG